MSEETKKPTAYKVTLSSKKVVHLREPKIKHTEISAEIAAKTSGDNATLTGVRMQQEMLKLLVVGIDNQPVKASDLEDLDSLFTVAEYSQLLKVMQKLTGGDEMGKKEPAIEFESFGGK